MGSHTFEVEAFLLVLPTTEYQKRVSVTIGTTITDIAVDCINQNHPKNFINLGKQHAVPPNLDDWYRHSQLTNISLRLPNWLICHPSPQLISREAPS